MLSIGVVTGAASTGSFEGFLAAERAGGPRHEWVGGVTYAMVGGTERPDTIIEGPREVLGPAARAARKPSPTPPWRACAITCSSTPTTGASTSPPAAEKDGTGKPSAPAPSYSPPTATSTSTPSTTRSTPPPPPPEHPKARTGAALV